MTAHPRDYETDPARFAAAREATTRWSTVGDVHAVVSARLQRERLAPVVDLGCGDGALRAVLPSSWPWVGIDADAGLLHRAGHPAVLADAASCGLRASCAGAVAALWMLYHLDDPRVAMSEARRVLRPGGLFVATTTARDDSPELHAFFGPPEATTFDAEEAAEIVAAVFGADHVEEERWDGPFVVLPDAEAVRLYLRGRGISAGAAQDVAREVTTPFTVTKRGVFVWARK